MAFAPSGRNRVPSALISLRWRIAVQRTSETIGTIAAALAKAQPAFDAARRLRHQPHDGITSDGFAGAGFANNAQSLAAIQLEGDILHGAHHSAMFFCCCCCC